MIAMTTSSSIRVKARWQEVVAELQTDFTGTCPQLAERDPIESNAGMITDAHARPPQVVRCGLRY